MSSFFERCRPFIAASDDRAAANLMFFRRYLFPDQFEIETSAGRYAVKRGGSLGSGRPSLPTLVHESGVPVVRIPSFEDDAHETAAIALVDKVEGSRLIVDVRGNGGGNTPESLISRLMERPYSGWRETAPYRDILSEAGEAAQHPRRHEARGHQAPYIVWPPRTNQPAEGAFAGKLVILTDDRCYSAAEDFIVPFKLNGRATLIGQRTGGSSGQPFAYTFPGGQRAWIGTKRQYFPDGTEFEGVGIAPDVPVAPTPRDIELNRDPVLETALQTILSE